MDVYGILTIVGSAIGIVTFNYRFMRNFKTDMNKNFEKHERRFEQMDQRLFLLCMGKTLPDILKAEREEKNNNE